METILRYTCRPNRKTKGGREWILTSHTHKSKESALEYTKSVCKAKEYIIKEYDCEILNDTGMCILKTLLKEEIVK